MFIMKEIKIVGYSLGMADPWLSSLITLIVAMLIAVAVHFIIYGIAKIAVRRSASDYDDRIVSRLNMPFLVMLLVLAGWLIWPEMDFGTRIDPVVKKLFVISFISSLAWLAARLVAVLRMAILMKYEIDTPDDLKARKVHTQLKVLERILVVIIMVIALAAILMSFESIRQVGVSLLASAGIAGIIIGFAAQRSIGLILAGFQIAITQPIRINDVVVVEGEWGKIEEITLTYVVVKIWDKRRLIVPITYFIEKPFQNWTRVSADLLGTVFIYTDYTVSVDAVRDELTRILKSDTNWDGDVNVVQITDAKENTMEVRALVSSANSSKSWDLRVNVREKLIAFLQKEYPESFPHTRVELKESKA